MTPVSRTIITTSCGVLALLGALCLAGCGGGATPQGPTAEVTPRQWGGGTGHASWSSLREINPEAEHQDVTACYGILGDSQGDSHLAFVILLDFEGSCNAGTTATAAGTRRYSGHLREGDGRNVEWQCETAVGKAGQLSINGSAYDLGKGPLFLVSTRSGRVQVRHVPRDLGHVKPNFDSLTTLLRDDPDVGAFLARTAMPE